MDAGGLPVFQSANQAAAQQQQQQQLNHNHLQLQQHHHLQQHQQQSLVQQGLHLQQQQQQQLQNQQQIHNAQQQPSHNTNSQQHQTPQQQPQQQQNVFNPNSNDMLPPKRQAVVDRLRRRIENYRRRQTDCVPRFEQTFSNVCEQQNHETSVLQKRFLESKAKRAAKKTEKKQPENMLAGNLQSSVHVQQKFLKRTADDSDNGTENYEPPIKLQHTGSENLTKFSVEIVQQLEFTTSAANSQPQQISTNVTVKALTNTSVKSEGQQQNSGANNDNVGSHMNGGSGSSGGNSSGGSSSAGGTSGNNVGSGIGTKGMGSSSSQNIIGGHNNKPLAGLGNLVECKQEPDHDFSDLAGLEKDAGPNGNFPGFPDLMGDDTNEENDTFKDLISDLQDFNPGFLDGFEEKPLLDIKTEDGIKVEPNTQTLIDSLNIKSESPMSQFNSAFGGNGGSDIQGGVNKARNQYQNSSNNAIPELSPAAQTLKHMAEQHQHKNAMSGMNFSRPPMQPPAPQQMMNSRFNDFGPFANDFISSSCGNAQANQQQQQQQSQIPQQFHKGAQAQSFVDMKQELFYSSQTDFDLKRLQQQAQMQQQQSAGLGTGPCNPIGTKMTGGFPKPPTVQAQQQQQQQAQQQYSPYNSPMSQSKSPNFMQQQRPGVPTSGVNSAAGTQIPPQSNASNSQRQNQSQGPSGASATSNPNSVGMSSTTTTLQMQQTQQLHISQQSGNHGIQVSAGQHMHLSGDMKSNVSVAAQQGVYFNQQQQNQQSQQHNPQPQQGSNNNISNNPQNQQTNPTASNVQGVGNDTYSLSQSQSISFTQQQQAIRQRQTQAAAANSVGLSGTGTTTMGSGNGSGNTGAATAQTNGPSSIMSQSGGPGSGATCMSNMSQMPGNGSASVSSVGPAMNMAGMNQTGMGQMAHTGTSPAHSMSGMGANMGHQGMNHMPNQMAGMGSMGPNAMNAPGNVGPNAMMMPAGGPMGMSQAKFLQQQQIMRAQALQQQHLGGNRPPPPEYKATQAQLMQAQMMHQSNAGRFTNAAAQAAAMRRITQQPIPPSGPMMRPQHSMFMQHSAGGGPRTGMGTYAGSGQLPGGPQRPPNVQVNSEGMPIGSQQEWRHMMMSQQQNMSFNVQSGGPMRQQAGFNSGNFMTNSVGGTNPNVISQSGPNSMQLTPAQMQQQIMRQQQAAAQQQQQNQMAVQQQQQNHQGMMVSANMSQSQQTAMQQMLQQQHHQQQQSHGGPQQPNSMLTQMQVSSMHMSQTQQVSMQQSQQQFVQQTSTHQQHSQQMIQMTGQNSANAMSQMGATGGTAGLNNTPTQGHHSNNNNITTSSAASSINQTINSVVANSNDLCLEFLDNLPVGDGGNFSAQDLLNSLDNDNFNIQDIL